MPETFEEFMKRVNTELVAFCGLGADDLPDAGWHDLYTDIADMRGPEFREAVVECMEDADPDFAVMARAITGG